MNTTQKLKFDSEKVDNIVGKGENAGKLETAGNES